MNRPIHRLAVLFRLASLALLLSACAGGSGSSGFDISPESVAIGRALDDHRCVQHRALTICPTNEFSDTAPGSPTPLATPTPLGTPSASPEIEAVIDPSGLLPCAKEATDRTCSFALQFAARRFPDGSRFFVAVRNNEPGAPWIISDHSPLSQPNGTLAIQLTAPSTGAEVQAAVLVFDSAPTQIPTQVQELADSGADFAYVTPLLILAPEPAN